MRKFSLLLFCILVAFPTFAKRISEQEALIIAQQFMEGQQMEAGRHLARSKGAAQMPFKNFYVFNVESDGGFVVVSGDDRTQSILGFAEHGRMDMSNLPCNVKWLFEYYDHAISTIDGTGGVNINYTKAKSAPARENISTIIHTQWGQGEPYNNLCPQVDGEKCVTGCVATAMAQVINYHRWPQAQTASVPSYTSQSNSILMPNLPKTQFDWNNMSPTAVAQLMLYCGQAVRMDYDVIASGAINCDIPDALAGIFGYSKSASLVTRSEYNDEQWDNMVYDELSNGRPILYFGQSRIKGGHAFIVDGYSNGKYHVNWGWGGLGDGYFILSNLMPDPCTDFNYNQEMIVNICPPAEAGDISRPKAIITSMTCSVQYLERPNQTTDFPTFAVSSNLESDLGVKATLQLGYALYDDNGFVKMLSEDKHEFAPGDIYVSEADITIDASLPQGDCRIVAVHRMNDTDEWLTNARSTTNYVAITIGETNMKLQSMSIHRDERVEYGVHTIDGITYKLWAYGGPLWASVLNPEDNWEKRYEGDIYIPDKVNYQNMTFQVSGCWQPNITFSYPYFEELPETFSKLTSLSIPLGDRIEISGCPNLTQLELRDGVGYYNEAGIIYSCHGLEKITYPQHCYYVQAPTNCRNLESIKFTNKGKFKIANVQPDLSGNSLNLWDKESMPALTDVYFAGDIPPTIESEYPITPNNNVKIHIPKGTIEVYKRSDWKYWNLVEDQPEFSANYVNWDYCGGDDGNDNSGIGVGCGDNDVEFAMRIPEEMIAPYKGCKITKIDFYTPRIFLNDNYQDNVEYVFLTTRDKDYIAKKNVSTVRGTWMSVELDQPYVITGEELFVGIGRHSVLRASWANYDIMEDGFWLRCMGEDNSNPFYHPGEWYKNAWIEDWNHPLPIRAILEGDKLPTDIVIANAEFVDDSDFIHQNKVKAVNENITSSKIDMANSEKIGYFCFTTDDEGNKTYVSEPQSKQLTAVPKKIAGANKQMRVKLRNRTPKLVRQVIFDWDVDGDRKGQQAIETAMLANREDIVYIDIPSDFNERYHTVTVRVSSINGESDEISINSCAEQTFSATSSTYFPRKIVLEEAMPGRWDGGYPKNLVFMENMKKLYPDNFIAILTNFDDNEMKTAFDGYSPFKDKLGGVYVSYINRNYWIAPTPFNIDNLKDKGEAHIKIAACSSDGKEVHVATETEFGFNDSSTEYRIAYVLTEDKVGPYIQQNVFSLPEKENDPNDIMDWWVHQDREVEILYNDVARAIYGDYYGVKGLFPNEIKEGETYKNQYMFSLPDNVQNKENLNVVTLLIDSRTGEIMNADRTPVEIDASGIHLLETDGKLFDVYNTMGMKVRSKVATLKGLPEGIYIVNGKKYVHR